MDKIGHWDSMVDGYEEDLAGLVEHVDDDDPKTTSDRQGIGRKLEATKASKASVFEFHCNTTGFSSAASRAHSGTCRLRRFDTSDSRFTEDCALIGLNHGKFD